MRRSIRAIAPLAPVLILMTACLRWPEAPPVPPERLRTFHQAKLDAIGQAITEARAKKTLPGGVFWLERNGVHFTEAYGKASVAPVHAVAQPDTIYDAASLTKVIATTTAVMLATTRNRSCAAVFKGSSVYAT